MESTEKVLLLFCYSEWVQTFRREADKVNAELLRSWDKIKAKWKGKAREKFSV
jgi:hypothetical protein